MTKDRWKSRSRASCRRSVITSRPCTTCRASRSRTTGEFTPKPAGGSGSKTKASRTPGAWRWEENPFVGTRPYQGLLVLLTMFNSTDLKNSNNTLYERRDGDRVERWYRRPRHRVGTGRHERDVCRGRIMRSRSSGTRSSSECERPRRVRESRLVSGARARPHLPDDGGAWGYRLLGAPRTAVVVVVADAGRFPRRRLTEAGVASRFIRKPREKTRQGQEVTQRAAGEPSAAYMTSPPTICRATSGRKDVVVRHRHDVLREDSVMSASFPTAREPFSSSP